jgi:CBS domain-containing protein
MQVQEIQTSNPACCAPDTNLGQVAQMMVQNNCGSIPVVDGQGSMKPVGIVTDRDITCRTVAEGKNPLDMTAGDCMTSPAVTVKLGTSVDDCCKVMEDNQIRRILVVDGDGSCCGIVAQADIARSASEEETAEVVREISMAA